MTSHGLCDTRNLHGIESPPPPPLPSLSAVTALLRYIVEENIRYDLHPGSFALSLDTLC